MTKPKIWLSSPHMGGEELKFVQEAFDTNWIAPAGPHIGRFEEELGNYVGVSHVAALSSGTAAIHLALVVLGVSRGDEVICSSFTFAGSCNPIVYVGAKPVFVDSERETWNMDPQLLEEAIRDRKRETGKYPKAIIIVHLYGMPAKMNAILDVAKRYDIYVIEDAAEALGSSIDGKKVGSFGDIGILSFNGNKIITTSGGGAFLSTNRQWVDQAKFLSTQARDTAPYYEHSQIGYNYRLSNVSAAIGLGQLKILDEHISKRRENFQRYVESLAKNSEVSFLYEPSGHFSNRWLTTILFDEAFRREKARLRLESENIESRPLWKPMHLQPVYAGVLYYGKGVAQDLFDRGLCLPSGSNLLVDDLHRISELIHNV
ncbi:MAG: aminotransferase class I/II-fold pyridoxal phosphate-dependent enzyme [Cyclobacteriaceae bacterium]|nr:aminotransferase class I/II-fold pyridoxal phosphate-dependent enzyme [Cyclobacteriaceae bacterium]